MCCHQGIAQHDHLWTPRLRFFSVPCFLGLVLVSLVSELLLDLRSLSLPSPPSSMTTSLNTVVGHMSLASSLALLLNGGPSCSGVGARGQSATNWETSSFGHSVYPLVTKVAFVGLLDGFDDQINHGNIANTKRTNTVRHSNRQQALGSLGLSWCMMTHLMPEWFTLIFPCRSNFRIIINGPLTCVTSRQPQFNMLEKWCHLG